MDDLHPHQDIQPVPDYQPVLPGPSVTASVSRLNTFARPTTTARKASFSLDKNKQLKKLRKDSVVSNFEIEVSPGNENVNIHCSIGFYTKVAIPTFEHLSAGVTTTIGDVIVNCYNVPNVSEQVKYWSGNGTPAQYHQECAGSRPCSAS